LSAIDDQPPPGAPDWLVRIYRMGGQRPGETQAQLCERRGRESDARYQAHVAGIAAAKAARQARGEPEPQGGAPYYGVGGHLSASEYAEGGYRIVGRARR
jgi:hypothetical protein